MALIKKFGVPAIIFITLFSYLFYNNRFYLPSELTITTFAYEATNAKLYWDTGAGFNERESAAITPYKVKPFQNQLHHIKISRLAETNQAAQGSEVWIDSIFLNGSSPLDLTEAVFEEKSFINENNKLALSQVGGEIELYAAFTTLDIVFLTHEWAGKVAVTIDGHPYEEDLYSPHTVTKRVAYNNGAIAGAVENKLKLPQLNIKAFKMEFADTGAAELRSVTVQSSKSKIELEVPEATDEKRIYVLKGFDMHTESFQKLLLVAQLMVSFIVTAVLYCLWRLLKIEMQESARKTLHRIFLYEQRWCFWALFIVSFSVFFLWLLGQWPGIMTVDSYHYSWREIKTFQFQNVTPWIYNFYLLMLTQLYDSPVIVSLFQLFVTSLLGSTIMYDCLKRGANAWIVVVCSVLFVTSVPVGIYNITLWKDVPFNTLVLFWGFVLFRLFYMRKYEHRQPEVKLWTLFILACALFLVALLRHNGVVFLAAIPACLFFLKLLSRKNFWQFSIFVCMLFAVYFVVTPQIAVKTSKEVSEFFSRPYKVMPLAAIYTSPDFYSPAPEEDKALFHKWMSEADLKAYYTPVPQADQINYFLSRWSAMSPDDQKRLNRLYILRSLQNLPIFLSDRLMLTLGTMGFSSNVFITTNELRTADSDRSSWRPIEAYRLTIAPKVKWLEEFENKIIAIFTKFTGHVPMPMLLFNSFPGFIILLIVFCLFRQFPGSALYSFVFLFSVPFLVIALFTAEWRFLYFLFIGSYFVLPLVSVEYEAKRYANK